MSKTRFLLIQMVTAGALAGSARAEEPAPPPPAPVPAAPEAAAPAPAATAVASATPPRRRPRATPAAVLAPVAAASGRRRQRRPFRHRVRDVRQRHGREGQHDGDDVARQLQGDTVAGADGPPRLRQERRPGGGRRRHVVHQPDRWRDIRARSTRSAGRRFSVRRCRSGWAAGDTPAAGAATANSAGIRARSAMDNAMFAVNYFTAIAGGDLAYVDHKLTVQLEATLFQLLRVRGSNAASGTDSAAPTPRSGSTPATSSSRCCRSAASSAISGG